MFTYNDILNARRAVVQPEDTAMLNSVSSSFSFPHAKAPVKRGRDELDDENDMDLDDADDEARFGRRTAFVPFYQNA